MTCKGTLSVHIYVNLSISNAIPYGIYYAYAYA